MTAVSKDVYINKLNEMVDICNNTYRKKMKMKPADVMVDTYFVFHLGEKDKDPQFKIGSHVRISIHKNVFEKGYTPSWSKEIFVVNNFKNTVTWIYVIGDIKDEEVVSTFYQKELKKNNQTRFRIGNGPRRIGDKLYVKLYEGL